MVTRPGTLPEKSTAYAGRFAPSPTGELHLGSLLAAVVSYMDARANSGSWKLRIEDLDPPRSQAGATQAIIESLFQHSVQWDGEPVYQSERLPLYQAALEKLQRKDKIYYCNCARKSYQAVYPGTCRSFTRQRPDCAIRIRVPDREYTFTDLVSGPFSQQLEKDVGDFIIKRRDGLFAYQLAVVTDDADMGITHVVRGDDLLDNTPRQMYLFEQLGYPAPQFLHHPTIRSRSGQKLSKQTFATPVDNRYAARNLLSIFDLIGLAPPAKAHRWQCPEILQWGIAHWRYPDKQITTYVGF